MIDLWYLNTNSIDQEEVKVRLKDLPDVIINEISRYKNHSDRRLKLYGKLILKKFYEENGIEFNWSKIHIQSGGKPYYIDAKKFNISHSGDYVAVAFSDEEIGVDIEWVTQFDIESVLSYLHPLEAEYVKHSTDLRNDFFKIWTRKEAFLKAIGSGVVDGLHNENCLHNELTYKGKWYIHSLKISAAYQIALCTIIHDCKINVRELFPNEFQ